MNDGVSKMVGDNVVCERWCVNDGVCDKVVCERGRVKDSVPRLPRKVPRRHLRLKPAQARHQSQPSAISATPAPQNEGRWLQVPRLPRETKVDVAKRHACHAKMVGNKVVCERWCVAKLCVPKLCVKDGV